MMKRGLAWYATEEQKKLHALKLENSESFIARGGKVQVIGTRSSCKKIDAQKLLDKVVGTKYEKEVIALLRKQGIQVEAL
jgi:hypothetical protein